MDEVLKTCTNCGESFTLGRLATDPLLVPIGMSCDEGEDEVAYYLFQHETPECGTSMLVSVSAFRPLITERIPNELLVGSEACEKHCVNLKDLQVCNQPCFNAPFRRFLLKMIAIKKRRAEERAGMVV
jgi:hypothetical protein